MVKTTPTYDAPWRSPRCVSERHAETQLDTPRRVREIRARCRLSVLQTRLVGDIASVVCPIEHIEYFHKAIGSQMAGEPQMPLEPHVEPMDRQADEAVARHDRSVRSQPVGSRRADQGRAHAGARCDGQAFA